MVIDKSVKRGLDGTTAITWKIFDRTFTSIGAPQFVIDIVLAEGFASSRQPIGDYIKVNRAVAVLTDKSLWKTIAKRSATFSIAHRIRTNRELLEQVEGCRRQQQAIRYALLRAIRSTGMGR